MNIYVKKSLQLLLSTLALSSLMAQAQDKSPWSVGAGLISTESPYAGTDNRTLLLPMINYEGEKLTFRGFALDYKLVENKGFNWSVILEPGQFFDSSDSDLAEIKALDDRKISLYAGSKVSYTTGYGSLSASASHDILGHGDGAKLKARYSYPFKLSKQIMLIPSFGVELSSSKVSNYYYGVTKGESNTFDAYELGSTVNYNAGMLLSYQLNKKWNVSAMINYTQLDSDIEDSPIIDTSSISTAMMSVSYQF
ncbi:MULTISPECIES: MipA/OmpV family protein [unclassified Pseudoalteromonas]|uniref:MipA/OmpV family protein n=1 Tax=unclassified Pseudoalteromonas TaxID=194690 RepID=UPI0002AAB49A|nr:MULTISPECIES: MipA/OmpV family protein [unclassified Pseudoalteromonas]ALQ09496.1 scaffolding protein [Pseudoalteromonas sp. Bsw20308]KDC55349.1 scaffolding protein [Pseudoalteromonas sp. S3431]